ncbi:MAG TPA: thioredoxin-dependent thiol peroxidase [Gemmatimonadales bacterium]|jgi:peroxiredoxin Q/BCP|nr:thioredoxin-dependent thiol peroxidase [Gemmatimonadales bacterium]
MVSEGKSAPAFTLDTDSGGTLSLKELKGRPVVLYFYPKDDTPGCTVEACEFRDAFPRFKGTKAVILGISPDSVKSHQKFKEKFDLPFTLLADPDHEIAAKYGVWRKKAMYGRTYMGIARTTFVIDKDGKIAKVFEKVKPKGHAEAVEQAIDAL